MDSRDSASSSSSSTAAIVPKRDGEDDGALNALAREAASLFESGKYDECVNILNQLHEKKNGDPKIMHNLAIAEFFRDGCSNVKKLLAALKLVKKRSKELACASEEQTEPNTSGNKSTLALKGNSTSSQLSATNTSSGAYVDEFDPSVATYNTALLWFHHHEYSRVLSILDPLYHNIEPIDEATALRICLLLLDASLACQDASRSADVFHYLEKAFGAGAGSQGDGGSAAQQHSANLGAKSSSLSSGPNADASSLDQSANASDNPLSTLSEDSLESMLKSFGNSGHHIGRPTGLTTSNDFSRNTADRSLSAADLKLKLQLYKVQLLLLTRSLKVAKREVKHAINVARGKDSSMALLLKSQLEHARGNHSKAIKLLTASSNTTEVGFLIMFYNNLGCIYYHLGKSYESSVLFSKALKSCSSLRKEEPQSLSSLLHEKSLLILYNCGMQYLNGRKPILAARCFHQASLVFFNRPLFWLRFAECSLMAFEKRLITAEGIASDRSEIRIDVIGKGKWRQLAVKDGQLTMGLDIGNDNEQDDPPPKLSLSFARQCIYNALHILNYSGFKCTKSSLPTNSSMLENQPNDAASSNNLNQNNTAPINNSADAKEQKGGTNQENVQSAVSFYEEARAREYMMIKQVLLANLSFVELELENPLKALSVARSLVDFPSCSRVMTFMGHVYAAEALCLLNRPKEAAELLSIYLSGGNKVELPYNQEHLDHWHVEKIVDCEELNSSVNGKTSNPEDLQGLGFLRPETAQGTLLANLATMAALQGELEEARQYAIRALSVIPDDPDINLTAVYVDLRLGDSQSAISRLKQYKHVRFLPCNLSVDMANL